MFKVYEWLEEYFAILVFLVICIVMILQVFFRLFLGIAFSWSIELSQYLNVWITFIAIGYVRKLNSHIKIEMFYDWVAKKIPVSFERGLFVLKKVLNIVYMLVVIILGLQLSIRSVNFRSSAMQISQFWLYICVPIGAAGYLFREIHDIYHVAIKKDQEVTV